MKSHAAPESEIFKSRLMPATSSYPPITILQSNGKIKAVKISADKLQLLDSLHRHATHPHVKNDICLVIVITQGNLLHPGKQVN